MVRVWQFISSELNGRTVGQDDDARRVIRTNAMRTFRRQQRLEMVRRHREEQAQEQDHRQSYPVPSSSHPSPQSDYADALHPAEKSDPDPKPKPEQTNILLPWGALSLETGSTLALDPFSCTSLGSQNNTSQLFLHFIYDIMSIIQPFDPRLPQNPFRFLAQQALADPVLLGVLLFHSAVQLDQKCGRPWTRATLYHQTRSLGLLSQRLKSGHALSDSTIVAVGFIGSTGNINGNVHEDTVHRNALRKMVAIRGGLESLGCHGVCATLLPIGDLINVTISSKVPILDRLNLDTNSIAMFDDMDEARGAMRPIHAQLDLASFCSKIRALTGLVARLASLHAHSLNTLTATTDSMIAFLNTCSAIEHDLLSIRAFLHIDESLLQLNSDFLVHDASRIGTLLCITFLFRNFNLNAASYLSLQKSLRDELVALDSHENTALDEHSIRRLLWICCIGGITSRDHFFYALRIRRFMHGLRFESKEDLESCLTDYIWMPKMYINELFDMLWNEVEGIDESVGLVV